jgi:hypothetical protein
MGVAVFTVPCAEHTRYVSTANLYSIILISGNLKNTLSDSSKVLEKAWGPTCEHGALYSKTGQEVAQILSKVTNITEAQNRYCVHCGGLCLMGCCGYVMPVSMINQQESGIMASRNLLHSIGQLVL